MARVDLYGAVHKGLVTELFDVAALVARTDFPHPAESGPALLRVRRLLGLLTELADAEDSFLLPEIDRISPVLASEVRSDRTRLRGLELTIGELVTRAIEAPERETRSLGYRLHAQLRRLVAEHLLEMEREETTVNRALWAHLSDDELREVRTRMVDSLPELCREGWIRLVSLAVSQTERTEIAEELGLSETELGRIREGEETR